MAVDNKLNNIKNLLVGQRVLIALSGGVDSSLLANIALDTLGYQQVLAVTVSSEIIAASELAAASKIASNIGINHQIIAINSLENPDFQTNPVDRCYHCKHRIYSALLRLAADSGYTMVVEGTNASDLDDYRPGLKALRELGVTSPFLLCGITKEEIRKLAQDYGLSNWDSPSNACLASRFPYHVPLTYADLKRVEACEIILHNHGFTSCRVRHHGDIARIEIPVTQLEVLISATTNKPTIIGDIKAQGYKYVTLDLEGYRTGSMNENILIG